MLVHLLTDVVLILTGFQLLVLAVVVLTLRPRGDVRRTLLAFFLLTKTLLVLRWSAYRFGVLDYQAHLVLYLMSAAGFFVLAPALYLHVKAMCSGGSRPQMAALVHFVPAAAMALVGAYCAAAPSEGGDGVVAQATQIFARHYWRFFWAANFAQIFLYIVAMFREVRLRRKCFTPLCAGRPQPAFRWLEGLLCVIFLHWLFVTSRATFALLDIAGGGFLALMDLFSITIFLVFSTILVVRGLATVSLFPSLDRRPTGLDEVQVRECAVRITEMMDAEQPYLKPSLAIDDLAGMLAIPSWQLSRVINLSFAQNFFNFVNGYRIEHAKRRLADPASNHKTMLRILHDAGFNSKSTFNEAFKRHTGMTPSEFRNREQAVTRRAS